jgi:uroporphyrin-III C-methyltransferase
MTNIRTNARPGKAYLVGAGPGQADLITVRGLRVLQQADIVIYDRLAPQALLQEARPGARLIYVGKETGRHTVPQDEINCLLVAYVQEGKQVVRLKGGDPFVFGRGGEEALALHAAGLAYEVIPGVSSAIAVPAYAGIPVSHRGIATSFAVVTGHERCDNPAQKTDWQALARIPTLVILMGIGQIREIAQALQAAGRSAGTPAAAIESGATPEQRVVRTTLGAIADAIHQAQLKAPAVIVIGEVAALHDQLAWFQPETLPATLDEFFGETAGEVMLLETGALEPEPLAV